MRAHAGLPVALAVALAVALSLVAVPDAAIAGPRGGDRSQGPKPTTLMIRARQAPGFVAVVPPMTVPGPQTSHSPCGTVHEIPKHGTQTVEGLFRPVATSSDGATSTVDVLFESLVIGPGVKAADQVYRSALAHARRCPDARFATTFGTDSVDVRAHTSIRALTGIAHETRGYLETLRASGTGTIDGSPVSGSGATQVAFVERGRAVVQLTLVRLSVTVDSKGDPTNLTVLDGPRVRAALRRYLTVAVADAALPAAT